MGKIMLRMTALPKVFFEYEKYHRPGSTGSQKHTSETISSLSFLF
jgi:hypothetical protein